MSKFIYVCSRVRLPVDLRAKLGRICARLTPDGLIPRPPKLHVGDRVAFAVTNPGGAMIAAGDSLLLGCLYGASQDWAIPGAPSPDGSFAMVRANADLVEVVSDAAGSRTVWTYNDNDVFICSTSQRAILMILGSFQFEAAVVSWMLSTGTLGPSLSWDQRIRRLQPEASLALDRRTWTTSLNQRAAVFSASDRSRDEHQQALRSAIEGTFECPWSYQPESLIVPLSGGYDSRAIVGFLSGSHANTSQLQTITWGIASRRDLPGSDGQVAAEVARSFGLPNRFLVLDDEPVAPELVLDRFIACSEGRVDHIAGYADGMAVWRSLCGEGVECIVRGDEGFGWVPAATERAVRYYLGVATAADYPNLESLLRKFDIPLNDLPQELERTPGESIDTWRDRMYHSFRIPTILAALSDAKLPYVELLNPLLSRRILSVVRTLPDNLRTKKALFREIATSSGRPNIPYATSPAIDHPGRILSRPEYVELIKNRLLDTDKQKCRLPAGLLASVAAKSDSKAKANPKQAPRPRAWFADLVPGPVKNMLRNFKPKTLDASSMLLRTFILVSMLDLIDADAAAMRGET